MPKRERDPGAFSKQRKWSTPQLEKLYGILKVFRATGAYDVVEHVERMLAKPNLIVFQYVCDRKLVTELAESKDSDRPDFYSMTLQACRSCGVHVRVEKDRLVFWKIVPRDVIEVVRCRLSMSTDSILQCGSEKQAEAVVQLASSLQQKGVGCGVLLRRTSDIVHFSLPQTISRIQEPAIATTVPISRQTNRTHDRSSMSASSSLQITKRKSCYSYRKLASVKMSSRNMAAFCWALRQIFDPLVRIFAVDSIDNIHVFWALARFAIHRHHTVSFTRTTGHLSSDVSCTLTSEGGLHCSFLESEIYTTCVSNGHMRMRVEKLSPRRNNTGIGVVLPDSTSTASWLYFTFSGRNTLLAHLKEGLLHFRKSKLRGFVEVDPDGSKQAHKDSHPLFADVELYPPISAGLTARIIPDPVVNSKKKSIFLDHIARVGCGIECTGIGPSPPFTGLPQDRHSVKLVAETEKDVLRRDVVDLEKMVPGIGPLHSLSNVEIDSYVEKGGSLGVRDKKELLQSFPKVRDSSYIVPQHQEQPVSERKRFRVMDEAEEDDFIVRQGNGNRRGSDASLFPDGTDAPLPVGIVAVTADAIDNDVSRVLGIEEDTKTRVQRIEESLTDELLPLVDELDEATNGIQLGELPRENQYNAEKDRRQMDDSVIVGSGRGGNSPDWSSTADDCSNGGNIAEYDSNKVRNRDDDGDEKGMNNREEAIDATENNPSSIYTPATHQAEKADNKDQILLTGERTTMSAKARSLDTAECSEVIDASCRKTSPPSVTNLPVYKSRAQNVASETGVEQKVETCLSASSSCSDDVGDEGENEEDLPLYTEVIVKERKVDHQMALDESNTDQRGVPPGDIEGMDEKGSDALTEEQVNYELCMREMGTTYRDESGRCLPPGAVNLGGLAYVNHVNRTLHTGKVPSTNVCSKDTSHGLGGRFWAPFPPVSTPPDLVHCVTTTGLYIIPYCSGDAFADSVVFPCLELLRKSDMGNQYLPAKRRGSPFEEAARVAKDYRMEAFTDYMGNFDVKDQAQRKKQGRTGDQTTVRVPFVFPIAEVTLAQKNVEQQLDDLFDLAGKYVGSRADVIVDGVFVDATAICFLLSNIEVDVSGGVLTPDGQQSTSSISTVCSKPFSNDSYKTQNLPMEFFSPKDRVLFLGMRCDGLEIDKNSLELHPLLPNPHEDFDEETKVFIQELLKTSEAIRKGDIQDQGAISTPTTSAQRIKPSFTSRVIEKEENAILNEYGGDFYAFCYFPLRDPLAVRSRIVME